MLKRLMTLLLACLLLIPAMSAAESGSVWSDTEIDTLVIPEERYQELFDRAAVTGGAVSKLKKKYSPLFTESRPMDMLREGIVSGDTDRFLQGCAFFRLGQQSGCFSPDNSAWLDELIAAGEISLATESTEQVLAMMDAAAAEPDREPLYSWSFRIFNNLISRYVARLREFLDLAGYTPEEYEADSLWASAMSPSAETRYIRMPDGTAALLRYGGGAEYEVLSEYEGCPVTAICSGAFRFTNIQSVKLPDSLVAIRKQAFFCTPLTGVVFPDSVTEIGEGAFAGCPLESVALPAGLTEISDFAFAANRYLQSLTIPDGVRSIGMSAFSMSSLPERLVIPGSVETIGEHAFSAADTRISRYMSADASAAVVIPNPVVPESGTTVVIENGLKEIGNYAFASRYIADICLPESLETVGICAFSVNGINGFSSPSGLKHISVAPENPVLRLAGGALFDRGGERLILCLTDEPAYTVPESTRAIARYAFAAGVSLSSLTLPESLTTLEDYAFMGCLETSPIRIPAGVTEIGKMAFYTDWSLRTADILVVPGSYAEQFCLENGIPYGTAP